MNYGQCRDYLQKLHLLGIKLGLKNITTLLAALDNPHRRYPSVLVAGTNGKGSVCAMLAHALSLHGFRVGLYTSPHLVKVEERIRVGEDLIPRRDFCRLTGLLKKKADSLVEQGKLSGPPTFFEFLTCLSFLYFREQKADIAILEVGMGGQYDATNVVTPVVSVITTISLDHQEYLGQSLSRIAGEKAGIIKPGVPVVCGVEKGQARRVLEAKAREAEASFLGVFDRKRAFKALKRSRSYRFTYELEGEKYQFSPGLPGEHQGRNAAVVIAAAYELNRKWKKLKKSLIIKGIKEARWAGRLELIARHPLVILDGAHNEEGARALRRYILDFIGQPLTLVFAVMRDKSIKKMAQALFPLASRIVLTRIPYSRAADPGEIVSFASRYKGRMIVEADAKKAVQRAIIGAGREGVVVVTGSLFLVGEIKRRIAEISHLKSFQTK
jgi:dihydrofolate synthase/folylpolyglutamate synthase